MPAPEELSSSPVPSPTLRSAPPPSLAPVAVIGSLRLEPISCDGCGRTFMAADATKLIVLLRGACSDCGGKFHLAGPGGP